MMKHNISQIGLGMAAIGRPLYINLRGSVQTEAFSKTKFKAQGFTILDEAYRLGIRFFDTAPGYGLAEELLISWLQGKKDTGIKASTKWGYTYTANFDPNAKIHEVKEHSLAKLREQWKQSQQLLPFLTTYQIHSATFDTAVLENKGILDELYTLKAAHNLKIGITTSGIDQTEVIKRALEVEVNGGALFDSVQATFNILDNSILTLKRDLRERGIQLLLKEVLANGRLLPNKAYTHYTSLYTTLGNLANGYGVGIDAIALRYAMDHFPDAIVLSGASTLEHLRANLKAADFRLKEEELVKLQEHGIAPEVYWKERKQLAWN